MKGANCPHTRPKADESETTPHKERVFSNQRKFDMEIEDTTPDMVVFLKVLVSQKPSSNKTHNEGAHTLKNPVFKTVMNNTMFKLKETQFHFYKRKKR